MIKMHALSRTPIIPTGSHSVLLREIVDESSAVFGPKQSSGAQACSISTASIGPFRSRTWPARPVIWSNRGRHDSRIHCDVPWRDHVDETSACHTDFDVGMRGVRRLYRQQHAHHQSGYYRQTHIVHHGPSGTMTWISASTDFS